MDVVSGMDVVDIAQNPTDPINGICLGADVACAVISVATAGGAMVRAAEKAGDAVDAVADTAKTVDHVGDAVKSGLKSPSKYNVSSKLFGKKWGKHKIDYPNLDMDGYKDLINDVFRMLKK